MWRVYRSACRPLAGNNVSTPAPIDLFSQYLLCLYMNSPRELEHQQKRIWTVLVPVISTMVAVSERSPEDRLDLVSTPGGFL